MLDKKKWSWKRWTFIGLVTVSFVYLCILFGGFLHEADTTFTAATQISDNTLASMIVHRMPFTPPPDTLIRVRYIDLIERVLRGLDTMQPASKDLRLKRRKFLADIFNSNSISIDEYRWIRRQIIRTLRLGVQEGLYTTKQTPIAIHTWLMEPVAPEQVFHSDTLNIGRLRMAAPFLIRYASPFTEDADREAYR